MARAVRVRVGDKVGGIVVVACGNDKGRFDFVKLDALQLRYGSTIADAHQHRVRDMRLYAPLPDGPFAEPMILSTAGRVLQLTSLRSNHVALSMNLDAHGWSCVALASLGAPTAVACGSQDGSVVIYDVRRPAAPLARLPSVGAGRGQPLFALDAVRAAAGGATWLVGASAGRLSNWELDVAQMSLVRSFAPVAWADDEKCRSGVVAGASLFSTHQVSSSAVVQARFQHRLLQGFAPDSWPPACEAVLETTCSVAAADEASGDAVVLSTDAVDPRAAADQFSWLRLERGRVAERVDLPPAPLVVSGSTAVDAHVAEPWIAALSSLGLAVWRRSPN